MFGRSKRLTRIHKLLAVRVSREKFELAAGNPVEFERLVREDGRVKMIDPALIMLFIQVAMAIFKFMRDRQASKLSLDSLDDNEVFLGSIKFGA
jgi:hypothetical protein